MTSWRQRLVYLEFSPLRMRISQNRTEWTSLRATFALLFCDTNTNTTAIMSATLCSMPAKALFLLGLKMQFA